MVDIEMLRIEKLIEEREVYENSFFSMEYKDEEFKFRISQFEEIYQDYLVEPVEYELFEPFEDYFEKLRDEKLIKERESYELQFFKNIDFDDFKMDTLDILISSYDECDYPTKHEFENLNECNEFFDNFYVEEPIIMNKPACGYDLDYLPNDDIFDNLDCYDYPDGPNENLGGIIFHF